jgi:phospholipid/cholesterol/gamma-HCH transport system permease protein
LQHVPLTRLNATARLSETCLGEFGSPFVKLMASIDSNLPVPEPSLWTAVSDGVKKFIQSLQDYTLLSARAVAGVFVPPHYVRDLLEQMDIIGVGSMPIVLLTGFFIGGVLVLQTAQQFVRFGETSLTGDVVALSLVRELGPTIAGLMVAGRNASGIASELGSMLVTEQVDAMRAMGTDPIKKLVTPRVVAALLVLPLLTAMADLVGLFGGFIVSYLTLRIGAVEFWTRAVNALQFSDLMQGLAKPLVFGFVLASVGCYQGLTVRGGTQGVGRATTQAVVVASVTILISDFFLSKLALFFAGTKF